MQNFKELSVWQKSHNLTLAIYQTTIEFPMEEKYGLTSQIRRSCSSIPANVAEGCGRNSSSDFARFLQIGLGSASELEYHLLLAHDIGYLNSQDYDNLNDRVIEIKKMLSGLISKIRAEN